MKKLIICLLVIAILFCTAGCATYPQSKNDSNRYVSPETESNVVQNNPVVDNKNKLKGEIEFGTDFINGLAFVKVKGDDKNYCIDKSGNIIFELSNIVFETNDPVFAHSATTTGFYNDLALISDLHKMKYITICDINGKITTAEELGVTFFLEDAFKDGYIITVTEGSKSKDDQIGVLNFDFEWVVEPSSEITKSLGFDYGVYRSPKFYYDHIFYGLDASVNIQTGEILSESYYNTGMNIHNSLSLSARYDGYVDGSGQLVVDIRELRSYGNATADVDGAEFVNGKAPVIFSNNTDWIRFSIIDTNGEMLFEPVTFGENIDYIKIDGDYIFVVGDQGNYHTTARMYDINGNLISELDPTIILVNSGVSFQDGVVRVSFGVVPTDGNGNAAGDPIRWVKYFGTDLQPLF